MNWFLPPPTLLFRRNSRQFTADQTVINWRSTEDQVIENNQCAENLARKSMVLFCHGAPFSRRAARPSADIFFLSRLNR